jgi:hypothetical protein
MSFRTLTARRAGVCKRCGQPIAVGQVIRWSPRGGEYHLAADCPAAEHTEDANAAQVAPRYNTGARYGRCNCIDYPCCGH